ncbi:MULTISPECIES: ABC transporter permease [unclassified Janthinobacterium]|uniref:ABC transporter permease n=1 Tax=unclassified Janthinobacterium TaxID=2610881 RepID=UPI00034D8816|nr:MULTISPECIES: ABC transporter permease [unclassified Janthinobacterium]MEC5161464.1 sodium transport system permease protein [Janthinobacterium sp. CG_S6]
MKPKWMVVLSKELLENLRDRRTLVLLLLFVLLYPALYGVLLKRTIERASTPEREGIELVVIGGAQAPTLMAQLRQNNVTVSERAPMSDQQVTELLRQHKVVAVLKLERRFGQHYEAMRPAHIELWYDSAAENQTKQNEVEQVLREYSASIASARLLAHGVSPTTGVPIKLQRYDTGTSASRSANFLGALLGGLFLPVFIFCMSSAVDSTAGERERRSLEVLLAQPASALELVVGKWLAAAAMSVIGFTLELMLVHAILRWLPLEEIGMSWNLGVPDLLLFCLASVPLSLLAAGLEVALAMNAKSFKEAQSMISFVTLIPMVPVVAVPMLGLSTATWMYLVPVLSHLTLLRELAKGQQVGYLPFALTFVSALAVALLTVAFASWRMKSERYVLSV